MIWEFIQNQILGMKWLNELIGNALTMMGLDINTRVGGSIQFFIYDVLKITVLLCFLIYMISYIQSYFPPERSKKIMGRFKGISAHCIAALLGTVTPFCSCSSIPLFIGFTSAGLPLGVTFSFLISSPMVDLGSLILLMSIFGTKVAVVYVIFGLVIAVAGGTLIEKMHLENYVEAFVRNASAVDIDSPTLTQKERLEYAKDQVVSTFRKVFPYIVVGVGIGGTFEKCALLAKKALTRDTNVHNSIPYVKEMEEDLLEKINNLGIGPAGLGGRITALAVNIETYPTHIAGLPVAVNMCCHVNRHKHRVI